MWGELDFTPSSSLLQMYLPRPCSLSGSWTNAMPWLHTGKHSGLPLESEFVCDSGLRASVSFSHFSSLDPLAGMPVQSQYDCT